MSTWKPEDTLEEFTEFREQARDKYPRLDLSMICLLFVAHQIEYLTQAIYDTSTV